ncbi:hypothetical protein [Wenzhouxiangella limi]|uniref:Right handed beta helix domain-containing protein n=1 Tax=Wenzhouxiangella limi TaxID=2707351 RepID=A0A845UV21_9GAMM|nr:hypothetical protein [Wenzhouxiangella limi]NDY94418.1 hypothetical protein [Wenzhouxiangella limi]
MFKTNPFTQAILAGVLLGSAAAVDAATIRVGTDDRCDIDNLSDAVDKAGSGDTILITDNQSYDGVSIRIAGKSLTLEGGYESCSSDTPDGRTVLGTGSSTAIEIDGDGGPYEVNLINLEITGVETTDDGAAIRLSNPTILSLENVRIHGNTTTGNGGAIFMNGNLRQGVSVDSPRTEMTNNQANLGGAIYCEEPEDTDPTVQVDINAALISGNRAVVDDEGNGGTGGGIYLDNCDLTLRAGELDNGQVVAGIHANSADRNGGGISVRGRSKIVLEATTQIDSQPLIDGNQADGWGGGLHCFGLSGDPGARPEITMTDGLVHDNEARRGGGLYLASCNVDIYASGPDQGIQNNVARTPEGQFGLSGAGGIWVQSASALNIDGGDRSHSTKDQPVYLSGNISDDDYGAMHLQTAFDSSPDVNLRDVRIEDNEARRVPGISQFGGPTSLTIKQSEDGDCPVADGPDGCSQIINNRQTSDIATGVAMRISAGELAIERTVIRGNSGGGASSLISTLEKDSAAPEVDITSSLIVDNQIGGIVESEGDVRIAWTTMAGNVSAGGTQPLFQLRFDALEDDVRPTLDLISSIVWEPDFGESSFFELEEGILDLADCVVTHDPEAVDAEARRPNNVIGKDPDFGGPQRGDWTVSADSPAFRCDDSFYANEADLLGAERGVEVNAGDPLIFAAGAYAIRSANILFRDRFQAD